jgi:uncharacterized membrane protein
MEEQIRVWDQVVPGSAERMLNQVEKDYEHRRHMDRIEVGFRVAGAVIATFGITAVVWTAKYLVDHDAAIAGASLIGSSIVALAGLVVARERQQR